MTEFDDEVGNLFREEAANDNAELETVLALERAQQAVLTALALHGAPHVWHPDTEQRRAAIERVAAEGLQERPDSTPEDELGYAAGYAVHETALVNGLIMALVVKDQGLSLRDEAQTKKQLSAQLLVSGYSEEWLAAVDSLLEGAPLDLGNEADMTLYVNAAFEADGFRPGSIGAQVSDILSSPESDDEYNQAAVLLMRGIHRAHLDKRQLPNAEAYIYEQERVDIINPEQRARLLALLYQSEN